MTWTISANSLNVIFYYFNVKKSYKTSRKRQKIVSKIFSKFFEAALKNTAAKMTLYNHRSYTFSVLNYYLPHEPLSKYISKPRLYKKK